MALRTRRTVDIKEVLKGQDTHMLLKDLADAYNELISNHRRPYHVTR